MIRRPGPLVLLAASALLPGSVLAQTQDWEAIARSDIEYAYQTYRSNHPGWDDPANPGFRKQLEAARDAGLDEAAGADSRDDYARVIAVFNAGLSDGHARLGVTWPDGAAAKPLWPGFVLAWRGQQAIVHQAEPDSGWTVGSVILSCDGRPFALIARERIAAMGGRPNEEGHWWARMPQVLAGAEGDVPANECTAMEPGGEMVTRPLSWTPPPDNIAAFRRAAGEGDPLPIGLTEPAAGIHWIALPSFAPDAEGRAAYDRLFSDLAERAAALHEARAVVIDLRGNQGGSSSWSRRVARLLWGEDAVDARMDEYFRHVSIWWRASEDNRAYLESLEAILADQPAIRGFVEQAEQGVAAAIAAGETYWIEPDDDEEEEEGRAPPSPATDFVTPVYVIVPGQCASACLDALDTFTRFDTVTLMGAPSAADTTYMEVRRADLPSGQGTIVVPLKVWRGRPRPSGFVYHPRIRADSLEWTQEVFLEMVERDIAAGDPLKRR